MRPENRESVMFMLAFGFVAFAAIAGLILNEISKPEGEPTILQRALCWLYARFERKREDEHEKGLLL